MESVITKALEYMHTNLERQLTIEKLAQNLGYSKFHFCRIFKKYLGISPTEYWASLRIEKSYLILNQSQSILNAQLKMGYLSSGTFSSTFNKMTGLTPQQFQKKFIEYYQYIKLYEKYKNGVFTHYAFDHHRVDTQQEKHCQIHVEVPDDFSGIIFVGLFQKPVPNQIPIVGKALIKQRTCLIDRIPNGKYYLLACAIQSSIHPLKYFYLEDCLRELINDPILFPLTTDAEYTLKLRPKKASDPPITMSPVKLLVDVLKKY